jgi:hypothetical protein
MKYSLPPPQYWQDFQELTQAVAKQHYPKDQAHIYGREGQDQRGIDVYVEAQQIGVQAKNRRLFNQYGKLEPNGRLDVNQLKDIMKEASRFEPTLKTLIIATTALIDTGLQDEMFKINQRRRKKGQFPVEFWFWEDFQSDINNNQELLDLHYKKILPKIRGFDPDAVLLATVSDAFHRPALITPIRNENSGDDFLQALKDVQEALSTGISHDRETRNVRSRAIYGFPDAKSPRIRTFLQEAWERLQQTRNVFTAGLAAKDQYGSPAIEQRPNFLEIRDWKLEEQLNILRTQAVTCVNRALKIKKCAPILEKEWW